MLNCVYRLTSPRVFEPVLLDLQPAKTDVIVRPTFLSICNADMRYYRGARSAEVLAEKLPMALIHEAIGEVIGDPNGVFLRVIESFWCPTRRLKVILSELRII